MSKLEPGSYTANCRLKPNQVLPEGVIRIAAAVEYDGSLFCGWQKQKHSPSVQEEVNRALSKVANHPVETACAGRTDTGVHATNQIIHFDTTAIRPAGNWLKGTNSYLPTGIRMHWLEPVSGAFHARFSAESRTYRYIIYNSPVKPALLASKVSWYRQSLDEQLMHRAAQKILGERDLSSFRAAGCQSNTAFRNINNTKIWRQGKLVIFEITANAFLYHMVRNIAGALINVGFGRLSVDKFSAIVDAKDRTLAPATAHPDGLYLVNVGYSECFGLPKLELGPEMIVGDS